MMLRKLINRLKGRKMNIFRQGDVLLVKVDSVPANAVDVTESDRIVLAYGEVTGHAHALYEPQTKANPTGKAKLWDAGAERFLQVLEKTQLLHEEHSAIPLEVGTYKVIRQREFDDDEELRQRYVAD